MPLKVRKNPCPPPPNECPLSECLSIIRGVWTPNIIWYLGGGPRRFGELRVDIPGISAKMLTARLRELEDRGVLDRHVMPTSPPSVEYNLTALGRELLPVLESMAHVSHKLKRHAAASQPRP
ncbi:MAG: helix-turn-helix domain-containing protein [Pseudomonadota bacterium]|nr:helix-turn-helix domain-containing protein [Pseudomonadota bacterium]